MLSDRKRAQAEAIGTAVALHMFKMWAENPEYFPKGLKSVKGAALSLAPIHVYGPKKMMPELEAVALAKATEVADVLLAVAKRAKAF